MSAHPIVTQGSTTPDGFDLVEVGRTFRRGWRAVVGFTVLGAAAATAVVLWAPRRYEGAATVVLKTGDAGGSLLARVGMSGGGAAAGSTPMPEVGSLGGLFGSSMKSPLETEIQILRSRAVARGVIDSLMLQARVRRPGGIPATDVLASLDLPRPFKRARYDVSASAGGYRIRGGGVDVTARIGALTTLPQGRIALRADAKLPASFQLELLDREDALTLFEKRLDVSKAGGEVTKVSFGAGDAMTAARVPNAVVAAYLARRKTVDRGINQQRADFLAAKSDSVAHELASAERALRLQQERSGVLDPIVAGKVQIEQAALLRQTLGELDVEHGAVAKLLQQVQSGGMTARQLAVFPTFLKSPGIGELLKKLTEIEADRTELLGRRFENDPAVVALDRSAAEVERQLIPLATSYATAMAKQRADVASQLDTMRTALGVLPGSAESSNRLQREVLRLGAIYAGIQSQLVETRLAAIGEGGDVRQLDVAEPSKKAEFPKPLFTMGVGVVGGLVSGFLAAFLIGVLGRWAEDPREIERTVGVPALPFTAGQPLMLGGAAGRTVLVVPLALGVDTQAVAERLAHTAVARGSAATIFDLSANGTIPVGVSGSLRELEAAHDLTVVRLPALESDATAAALGDGRAVLFVAPPGRVDRVRLASAVESLRRLDVSCAGVVVSPEPARSALMGRRPRLAPVA